MLTYHPEKKHFLLNDQPILFSEAELRTMRSLHWYQRIPFSSEVASPGHFSVVDRLDKYQLNEIDFKGKSVLGIGCGEGFQLYYAEALGASKVVALNYDFGYQPPLNQAREFTRQTLQSQVEYIDASPYELDPATHGSFDVVMVFDAFHNLKHPLLALEKISSVAQGRLLLGNHFALSPNDIPWCGLCPMNEPEGSERNLNAPNLLWFLQAVMLHQFHLERNKIWEADYLVLHAHKEHIQAPKRVTLAEAPSDEHLSERTAILVISCNLYSQAWQPFFMLLQKYWPDCPYRIFLGTDTGTYHGVETIQVGSDKGWQANCLEILQRISAERIILFQEDFLICDRVNTTNLRKLVRHTYDYDVGCLRLCPLPHPTGKWRHGDFLGTIGLYDDFRFSLQLAIWKKSVLMNLLRPGEEFRILEFMASRRANFVQEPFLSVWDHTCPLRYFATGIDLGVWNDGALELLKREGIPMETITKVVKKTKI